MNREPHLSTGLNPVAAVVARVRRAGWGRRGALLVVCLAVAAQSQAADLYWDLNGSGPWATLGNWNTASDGSGVNPVAAPGSTDVAYFNISTLNAATTATLAANLSVQGMVFNNTGTTAINTDAVANRIITLGTSGLTLNAGAGAVTFGSDNANQRISFTLGGSQSWTNNSSNTVLLINITGASGINLGSNILTIAGSGNISLGNRAITGTGGSVVKDGTGTLSLGIGGGQDNTFTGGVTLNEGTLILGKGAALGTGALTITGGTIDVNGARTTTNVQNWNGDFAFGGANTWNTGTGAVTMNASRQVTVSASTMTVGGVIGDSGNSYGLTKAGAGTLALNGANTYTGTTTVKNGALTLGVSGAISNTLVLGDSVGPTSGTLDVTAMASFSQTNVSGVGLLNIGVGKAITIGGVLAPGNGGIGTLSVTGGVTWNAANAWIFELGTAAASLAAAETGSTGDLLSLTGAFGQGTGSTFSFDFANTGSDGWYKLVDYGSTTFVAGTNPSFAATNLPAGKTASFVVDSASSALYVQIVPEPATITLATIALATAAWACRSRSGSRRRLNVACHRHPAR
jgi:fibronectin-binding autotransporter adhesin